MITNKCMVCGMEFEASRKATFCSGGCRVKSFREGAKPKESEDSVKQRLDGMASFLRKEIGELKVSVLNMENRLVEMSNKYGALSSYVYKSMAELKKVNDPEHKTVDYSKE